MQKLLNLMKRKGIEGSSETHYWVVSKKRCMLCVYNVRTYNNALRCCDVHFTVYAYVFVKRVVYVLVHNCISACELEEPSDSMQAQD